MAASVYTRLTGTSMELIAEDKFDLSYTEEKMSVRLYAPDRDKVMDAWGCTFVIGEPIGVERRIYGETSLQALCHGLQTLSVYLYGSDLYKRKELGKHGVFGGDLPTGST